MKRTKWLKKKIREIWTRLYAEHYDLGVTAGRSLGCSEEAGEGTEAYGLSVETLLPAYLWEYVFQWIVHHSLYFLEDISLRKSGTTATTTISDSSVYEENPRKQISVEDRYLLRNTLQNLEDVGHLTVRVHRATGLAAADFGGKSDPFCVLELSNTRYQTETESKTLSPSWDQIFNFDVKDINSVLEVTVFDEDWEKVDFLGKVSIPLLRIRNGEQKWYCLKDKNLLMRAKGNCPMILLEMTVVWNPIRGVIRSLHPKEESVEDEIKFKIPLFVKNVLRLKAIIMAIIEWGKIIKRYCKWEKSAQTAVALIAYIALCYYFQPYMIPAILLTIFLKYYIVLQLGEEHGATSYEEELVYDHEEDEDKEKEEKKTLKRRLHEIQEITQTVQNAIGHIASLGEQVKNTFNFTVPFISYIAMGLTFTATVMLYFIPLRYVVMSVGIIKFTGKMIRPHVIPNNEIVDLLSRVPDDEELIRYRELQLNPPRDSDRKKDQRK